VQIYFRIIDNNSGIQDKNTFEVNLKNNSYLKDKFVNNQALLDKYIDLYRDTSEAFESNLINTFKDIVESGTYW
jgi:hypothetical protein